MRQEWRRRSHRHRLLRQQQQQQRQQRGAVTLPTGCEPRHPHQTTAHSAPTTQRHAWWWWRPATTSSTSCDPATSWVPTDGCHTCERWRVWPRTRARSATVRTQLSRSSIRRRRRSGRSPCFASVLRLGASTHWWTRVWCAHGAPPPPRHRSRRHCCRRCSSSGLTRRLPLLLPSPLRQVRRVVPPCLRART